MLAELVTLWDIPQWKIEVGLELISRQVHSQMFHKPGRQLLYEKVQGESESRPAYIQVSFFYLYILRCIS